MNTTPSRFDDYLNGLQEQQAKRRATATILSPTDPDTATEALSLGKEMGVAPQAVMGAADFWRTQSAQKRATTALTQAPRTGDWLTRDEINTAISKDDLENLTAFERFGLLGQTTAPTRALARGVARMKAIDPVMSSRSDAQLLADRGKSFDQLMAEEMRTASTPQARVAAMQTAQLRFDRASSVAISDQELAQRGADRLTNAQEIIKRVQAVPMSETATRFRDGVLNGADNTLLGVLAAFGQDPAGGAAFLAETGVESIPALASAVIATGVTRNPAVGASVMGGQSFLLEQADTTLKLLADRGVKLETPEDALAVIQNAELMAEVSQLASQRGMVVGLFDALSGGIAGQKLVENPLGDVVSQAVAQMLFGATGEAAGQRAAGQELDWRDIVVEGLAELTTTPIEVAGVGGRGTFLNLSRMARSGRTAARVDAIDELAAASKLKQRAPDRFLDFAENAGPDDVMFVPADKMQTYFQGREIDLDDETLAAWGIDPSDFAEKVAAGADVAVPLSRYAARISGTQDAGWFRENATMDPDEPSLADTADLANFEIADAMQREWETAQAQREDEDVLRAADEQINDALFGQLRAAGQGPDASRFGAQLLTRFFSTTSERAGLDALDTFRSANLRIEGPQEQAVPRRRGDLDSRLNVLRARGARALPSPQRVAADERRAALERFPELKQKRPFTRQITNLGGVEPGSPIALELNARGINARTAPGLFRKGGRADLDNLVASELFDGTPVIAADEATGYLDRNGVIDALEAELRGEQVPRSADAAATLERLRALEAAATAEGGDQAQGMSLLEGLDPSTPEAALASVLDAMGLDPSAMTNDEIAAALDARLPAGQQFDQAAPVGSEAFDRWFGDSKVVDEAGKPLVVYHGAPDVRDILESGFKQSPSRGNVYFTSDKQSVANTYADDSRALDYQNAEPHVIPLYMSLQNPLVIDAKGQKWRETEKHIQEARDGGHDGLIIKNSRDEYNNTRDGGAISTVYVAFEPTQMKSAMTSNLRSRVDRTDIGGGPNRGTFDPADPRILYQSGGSFDDYLSRVNPDGYRIASEDRPNIYAADMAGMLPDGAKRIRAIQVPDVGRVTLYEADGDIYATAMVEDLGEVDVIGYSVNTGDATDLAVAAEFQGRGIGSEIQFEYRKRSPDAPSGGLTEGGERALRRTFDRLQRDRVLYQFAGRNALTADQSQLRRAISMLNDEADAETVRRETGWFKGVDRKWRFEIDDSGASIPASGMPPFGASARRAFGSNSLGNVLDHATLYEAYPFLRDTRIFLNPDLKVIGRVLDYQNGKYAIEVNPTRLADAEAFKSTVLHEVQHVIQATEGFAQGANAQELSRDQYRATAGEVEARNVQSRMNMSAADRVEVAPVATEDVPQSDQYFQGEGAARGSITLPSGGFANGETVIRLFESADLSTFLHEAGHLTLEAFTALAGDPAAPQAMKDDLATIREYLKSEGGAYSVEQHEVWARSFEAYLMEGKAPSLALADAFARFKAWMTRIYRTVRGLNVRLSPEVRAVMDRMLANDNEIAAVREAEAMRPLFTDQAAAGMSESDFRTYQRMARRSVEQAEAALLERTMAKIRREREAWYRDEKEAVTKEVTDELNTQPIYRLTEMMARRVYHGETARAVPDIQLDRAAMVEMFGDGIRQELGRWRGKRGLLKDGGMAPQEAADLFGFGSVTQMVDALQNAPTRRDAIAQEVERRMVERHGDPLTDGTLEEEALAAIHNRQEQQVRVAEARHMARRLGRSEASMRNRVYQARARAMLGRMSVREATRSSSFLNAERRAARDAEKAFAKVARGGAAAEAALADALAAKERQIINGHLFTESRAFEQLMSRKREQMRGYDKKSVREKLAGGYIEQIDAILEDYDFRQRSNRAVERSESLRAFVDRMIAEGRENELSIDARLMDEARRVHYSRLSVDEIRGLFDTVDNLDHLGRFKQKLIDKQRQRELQATVDGVKAAFEANVTKRAPGRVETAAERRRGLGRQVLNWTLNADTLLREIDGRESIGPAWDAVKADVDRGYARLTQRKQEAGAAFDELFGVYSGAERRAMNETKMVNELAVPLSRWNVLSIAMNTGNADNYQRLTNPNTPGSFTPEQVDAVLRTLDERDWRFVQSMWDYLNSYWPEVAAKEKRLTGVEPQKVAGEMMTTAPDFVRGGYYPISYDTRLSAVADDLTQQGVADALRGGRFAKAQTAKGHTKERVSSVNRPLELDMSVAFEHVQQVMHDLELGEPVANSWRVLSSLKDTFMAYGRREDFDALESWLKDVAAGERSAAHGFGVILRHARAGFTFSRLALNIGTVALQPTGITQSFVVVGKAPMARGIVKFFANPRRWAADISAASPFMAERQRTFERDLHTIVGELDNSAMTGARWANWQRKYIAPLSFYLMQKVQFYSVDAPTWLAAYDDAVAKGRTEDDARLYADLMVKRAQGSGLLTDRGMLERGKFTPRQEMNEMPKLLTALGSYMFAKFNVAYERSMGTNWKSPLEVMSWASDMALLFTFEAVLAAVVRAEFPGGDDEDDDGWAEWLLKETGMSILGTIPFVRDAASALEGFSAGGTMGSIIDIGVVRPLNEAKDLASGEEFDRASVTRAIDAFGMWAHLPSSQVNRFIRNMFEEDGSWAGSNPITWPGVGVAAEGRPGRSLMDVMMGE